MAKCTICLDNELDTERDKHLQMCVGCSHMHGVIPLPRSRRSPIPCRGCNGLRFVRAVPRELTQMGARTVQNVAPMAVTYAYGPPDQGLFVNTPEEIDAKVSFGLLEMYICKGCGLVDWFCFDPEQIPIGPAYMTENIDYSSTNPYR